MPAFSALSYKRLPFIEPFLQFQDLQLDLFELLQQFQPAPVDEVFHQFDGADEEPEAGQAAEPRGFRR
jgi:hypothetical protein